MSISQGDLTTILQVLGRTPRGALKVMARCEQKRPQSLMVAPVIDGAPFPTLYWLVCPKLLKSISQIEAQGQIKVWEEEIAQSEELQTTLGEIHRSYARERFKLYLQRSQRLRSFEEEVLKNTGVGGVADFQRIRCLHMFYAYHLVQENFIGKRIDQLLSQA